MARQFSPGRWRGPLAVLAAAGFFQLGHGLPPGDDDPPPPVLYGGEITVEPDFTPGQPPNPGLIEIYKQDLKKGDPRQRKLSENIFKSVEKYLREHPDADPDRASAPEKSLTTETKEGASRGGGERVRGKPAADLKPAAALKGGAGSSQAPAPQERSQLGQDSAGMTQRLAGRLAGWLKPDTDGAGDPPAGAAASSAMGALQGGAGGRGGRSGSAPGPREVSGQEPKAGGLSASDDAMLARDIPKSPGEKIFVDISVSPQGLFYERSCELVSGQCNPLARESYRRGQRVRPDHAASLADVWRRMVDEAIAAEEAAQRPRPPSGDRAIGDRLARWLGSGGAPKGLFADGGGAGREGGDFAAQGQPGSRASGVNSWGHSPPGAIQARSRETATGSLRAGDSSSERASTVGFPNFRAPGGFGFLLAFLAGGAALLLLRPRGR